MLSQSFTQESKGVSILLGARSMMIDFGENVAQSVLGRDSSSAKSVEQDGFDICIVSCFGCKNVLILAETGTKAVSAPVLSTHLKKSCLQTCEQEGCGSCNPGHAMPVHTAWPVIRASRDENKQFHAWTWNTKGHNREPTGDEGRQRATQGRQQGAEGSL